VVVVIQAPARSGALITADFALDQGKEVLVHAGGLDGIAGEGGAALADSGARLVVDGGGILKEIGLEAPPGTVRVEARSIGERIARALERDLEDRG
jgi:DNA processing protein